MAVGVGNNINVEQLAVVAGDDDRVLRADSFSNLDSILESLRSIIDDTSLSLEGKTCFFNANIRLK